MRTEDLYRYIRDVADFPRPGILFKDITPLLASPEAFETATAGLTAAITPHVVQGVVAIESRGFIFGAALALRLGVPLHLVRKPGKLPSATLSVAYQLEYGSGELHAHRDTIRRGERCAVIDDVIATGGTAAASGELVVRLGGEVACYAFVIELAFLAGRGRLGSAPVEALLRYD